MDPANAGGGTPTTQWAPQSWWVGDDARSEDGYANDGHQLQLSRRRRSQLSGVDADTDQGRLQQQQGAPYRDPRSMFRDLPNSSFNPEVLGDPIQRELELRAAEAAAVRRSPADATAAVTFADISRQPSPELGSGDGATHVFWRDECARLQGQLASLAREKERWERDHRRLLAEDVDRARDLAGLRRAVEAQSQLVMESLVVAQRLAASREPSTQAGGRATALSDDVLQTAWVQPSVPPATTRNSQWGQGGGGAVIEPSPWGFPLSPRAGIATNRVRSEHGRAGVAENRSFDRRHSGSRSIADATSSQRENSTTAAAAPVVVAETPPGRGSSFAESQPPASTRDFYDPVAIANRNSRNNSSDDRIPRSPADVRSTSTEMVLAPRASLLARRYKPQVDADGAHTSTAYYDQSRTSGWRRIASSGDGEGDGGITVGGVGSGDAGKRESEVWEWNGRRVVLHGSTPNPPLAEKGPEEEAKTTGDQEKEKPTEEGVETPSVAAATATEPVATSAPIVPASLLDDIQEIKAAVRALASGAVGVRAPIPQTGSPVATTAVSSSEAATSSHQPKPPDNARGQGSGTSPSLPTSSPTRRRISVPTSSNISPAQQPNMSSIADKPDSDGTPSVLVGGGSNSAGAIDSSPADSPNGDGGVDKTERQRRPRESGQVQDEENHQGSSPGEEAPEVRENTQGTGEGPTSLLREEKESEKLRRTPSAPNRSGSGQGGAVDAGGDDHREPPLLEESPLVPVARQAYPGSSGRHRDSVNGGAVVVEPDTSIADEAADKDAARDQKPAEGTQRAEGDDDANGSSSSSSSRRRRSSSGGELAEASASSSPAGENNAGIVGVSNDDGRAGILDEAPEKCHVG